jgi:hypothetical protein
MLRRRFGRCRRRSLTITLTAMAVIAVGLPTLAQTVTIGETIESLSEKEIHLRLRSAGTLTLPRVDVISAPHERQPSNAPKTKVTISGCIRAVPPAAASPARASSLAAVRFELLNPRMATDATVSQTGQPRSTTRYELEGDDHLIGRHVNQYVEIIGIVAPSDAAAHPILKVETVTMMTVECKSS